MKKIFIILTTALITACHHDQPTLTAELPHSKLVIYRLPRLTDKSNSYNVTLASGKHSSSCSLMGAQYIARNKGGDITVQWDNSKQTIHADSGYIRIQPGSRGIEGAFMGGWFSAPINQLEGADLFNIEKVDEATARNEINKFKMVEVCQSQ